MYIKITTTDMVLGDRIIEDYEKQSVDFPRRTDAPAVLKIGGYELEFRFINNVSKTYLDPRSADYQFEMRSVSLKKEEPQPATNDKGVKSAWYCPVCGVVG